MFRNIELRLKTKDYETVKEALPRRSKATVTPRQKWHSVVQTHLKLVNQFNEVISYANASTKNARELYRALELMRKVWANIEKNRLKFEKFLKIPELDKNTIYSITRSLDKIETDVAEVISKTSSLARSVHYRDLSSTFDPIRKILSASKMYIQRDSYDEDIASLVKEAITSTDTSLVSALETLISKVEIASYDPEFMRNSKSADGTMLEKELKIKKKAEDKLKNKDEEKQKEMKGTKRKEIREKKEAPEDDSDEPE